MPASKDQYGRSIDYLRISVTDRCNLRCVYCMGEDGVADKLRHDEILSYDEIERFARRAVRFGIRRIRLTGGEPLVRRDLADLVAALKRIGQIEDISLTTNGILLPKFAAELKASGLDRVNISLDTLDKEAYRRLTRLGELSRALAAIDTALEYHFDPVKVNMVVMRSYQQDLFGFARLSIERPLHIRFIEYMPVGLSSGYQNQGWRDDEVIDSAEVIATISATGEASGLGPLLPLAGGDSFLPAGGGPARYWRFAGAAGTVGVISPLSNHFCGRCNRLRLTAEGRLRPCLFSDVELDARAALRLGDDSAIDAVIADALEIKPKEHGRLQSTRRLMSQIGG
ncbi:MAG: GTP 3',8-cyclase MoaA [Actinomycetia bacterium]|nr:GTP 3',8-cyclase MoaA [Actinomycetes bacterium]